MKSWIFVLVVLCGAALGVLIAGVPDRSPDKALPAFLTTTSKPPPPTEAPPTTTTSVRPANQTKIFAVNGSGTPGMATRVSNILRGAGYDVVPPGRDLPVVEQTYAYYEPGFGDDARVMGPLLKLAFEDVKPMPVPPLLDDQRGAAIVIVIGKDLPPLLGPG